MGCLKLLTRIICLSLATRTLLLNTPHAKDTPRSKRFGEVPNFAKHYAVITRSCGTECEQIAVVDTLTEAVYVAPFVAELGTQFRIDSRLLVVNPPDAIEQVYGHEPPAWVTTRYYRWEHHHFVLLYEIKRQRCFDVLSMTTGEALVQLG